MTKKKNNPFGYPDKEVMVPAEPPDFGFGSDLPASEPSPDGVLSAFKAAHAARHPHRKFLLDPAPETRVRAFQWDCFLRPETGKQYFDFVPQITRKVTGVVCNLLGGHVGLTSVICSNVQQLTESNPFLDSRSFRATTAEEAGVEGRLSTGALIQMPTLQAGMRFSCVVDVLDVPEGRELIHVHVNGDRWVLSEIKTNDLLVRFFGVEQY